MNLSNNLRKTLICLCVFSILIMLYLVFTPHFPFKLNLGGGAARPDIVSGHAPIIYIPFKEIFEVGFWLNVIMTMPIGCVILLVKKDIMKFRMICLSGLLVGLFIETTQFVFDNTISNFSRFVDVNDVISNMIGVILGFYILMWIKILIIRLIKL